MTDTCTYSICQKKRRPADDLQKALIYLAAAFSIFILAGIMIYVFYRGITSISISFLTTAPSALNNTFGILGNIINTLYIVVITLLIATPIGVGSAIYLNEYAKPGRIVRLIEFTTETLAGIPSIIFGLFGYVFFGTTLKLGYSILTGALTLSLMVLPLITRNTQEALKTVPLSYRSGALSIGATKWYMIRTILLPSAMPGIITGIILAVGRIVGESAALLFTAGSGYLLPNLSNGAGALISKIMEPGGTLTIQMYLCMSKAQYDYAFAIALVLLVIVLSINFLTKYLSHKFDVNRDLYYGNNHALKKVTMSMKENAITAFIGPSGCGKSTFLKTLNRMNDLVENVSIKGTVLLDGENIYDPKVDTTLLRKKVGMVFQQPNPFPMSIYDNVAYGPRIHGIKNKAQLDAIVEQSLKGAALWDEVGDRLKKSGLSLSGGQQQRLCIARALAVEPEVLLMDEPTSALDPISTLKIEDLMEELKKKYTVVIVTHNMQQAARISDYTAFFLVGEVVEFAPANQMFSDPKDKRTEDYITGRFG